MCLPQPRKALDTVSWHLPPALSLLPLSAVVEFLGREILICVSNSRERQEVFRRLREKLASPFEIRN